MRLDYITLDSTLLSLDIVQVQQNADFHVTRESIFTGERISYMVI